MAEKHHFHIVKLHILSSPPQGCDLSKQIEAVTYVECCAKEMDRAVKEVFDRTALIVLGKPLQKKTKRKAGKSNGGKSRGCCIM